MKKAIYLILATILFSGCVTSKKTKEVSETKEIHNSEKEKTKDSIHSYFQTLPTTNGIEFNLKDIASMMGDFMQTVNAGSGNESTIEKKGDKLIVTNKNSGSSKTETKVEKTEKEFVYDAKFVTTEFTKIVERLPWKFWLVFWIVIIVWFRKFIAQLLVAIFPALATYRLFELFIGKSQN